MAMLSGAVLHAWFQSWLGFAFWFQASIVMVAPARIMPSQLRSSSDVMSDSAYAGSSISNAASRRNCAKYGLHAIPRDLQNAHALARCACGMSPSESASALAWSEWCSDPSPSRTSPDASSRKARTNDALTRSASYSSSFVAHSSRRFRQ